MASQTDFLDDRTLLPNGVNKCADDCDPELPEDNCPILVSDGFKI